MVLRVGTYLRHELLWMQVFWAMALCIWVIGSRRFEGTTILRNVRNHLPIDRHISHNTLTLGEDDCEELKLCHHVLV